MKPRVAFTADMNAEQVATAALENLLSAAQVTMDLWNEYGLGQDHFQNEDARAALVAGITDARLALSR